MIRRVRILEKRVSQAVVRLRELSVERDGLREKLAALSAGREVPAPPADEPDGGEDWAIRRREAVSLIRQTLSELRAD